MIGQSLSNEPSRKATLVELSTRLLHRSRDLLQLSNELYQRCGVIVLGTTTSSDSVVICMDSDPQLLRVYGETVNNIKDATEKLDAIVNNSMLSGVSWSKPHNEALDSTTLDYTVGGYVDYIGYWIDELSSSLKGLEVHLGPVMDLGVRVVDSDSIDVELPSLLYPIYKADIRLRSYCSDIVDLMNGLLLGEFEELDEVIRTD